MTNEIYYHTNKQQKSPRKTWGFFVEDECSFEISNRSTERILLEQDAYELDRLQLLSCS